MNTTGKKKISDLFYHVVSSMVNGKKTDFKAGTITNTDAIAVLLAHMGPCSAADLRAFATVWRGQPKILEIYWGPHSGYTMTSMAGDKLLKGIYGPCCGAPKPTSPGYGLWFRYSPRSGKQPYRNALTAKGILRVAKLMEELDRE